MLELRMNFSWPLNIIHVLTTTLLTHATHTMCGPRSDQSRVCHLVVIYHTAIIPTASMCEDFFFVLEF